MRPRQRGTVLIGALIMSIGALYVGIVLALAPYRGFCAGDAGVKLWQMTSWIANDWRTPWASYAEVNAALDPHHRFAPLESPFAVWEEDRVITVYTSPYIFVSSLLLAKWGRLALYVPPLVAGVVGLVLEAWIGRRFSDRVAWVAVVVLGLATPWLFYSVVFWEHTVASVLICAALALLLVGAGRPSSRACVAAGLCLGAAVAIRPGTFVCILALAAVLVVDRLAWPSLGWLTVGLGLAGVAGWAYQVSVVGRTTASQVTANFAPSQFELWSVRRLLETSQMVVQSQHLGVLGLLVGAAVILGLGRMHRVLFPHTDFCFDRVAECVGPMLVAVGAIVLLFRGRIPNDLLTGVPMVCLLAMREDECSKAIPSPHWKRRLVVWCVLVVVLFVALAPNAGGPWGPRYLTPALGPLVLLSVEAWDRLGRGAGSRLARGAVNAAFAALVLAGVMAQGASVVRLRQVRAGNDALSRTLLRPPQAVVVTDLWFVPQIAPQVYGQEPFLLVRTVDEWRELDARLAAQGGERVRIVQLADQETPLAGSVAASWCALPGTLVEVPSVPPLQVADYMPRGSE